MGEKLAGNARIHQRLPATGRIRQKIVIAGARSLHGADADQRHLRLPGQIEDLTDRCDIHQQIALFLILGKQRRMNERCAAAELLRQLRGEMIDIRIVLALHTAGQRHHPHIETTLRLQIVDNGTHRLAAGNRDHIAVTNGLQQMVGGHPTHHLQGGFRIIGDRRRHHRLPEAETAGNLVFEVHQPLIGAGDGDLHHARLAAGRNHAVHLGVGKIEPLGDFRLLHTLDEMQHQDEIHLPLLIEIVLDIQHGRLSPVTLGRAKGAQRRRLTR